MKKEIRKYLYDKAVTVCRNDVLKKATLGLGKYFILDDRIVCFVDNKKLAKKLKKERINFLFGVGSVLYDEEKRELYGINKPIYYVIENMTFDYPIHFSSYFNSFMVFKNCYFKNGVSVEYSDGAIFENNKYGCGFLSILNATSLKEIDVKLFNSYGVRKLSFVNDCLSHYFGIKVPINISASEVNIVNSCIDGQNVCLHTENLVIDNSKLLGDKIEIKADTINSCNGCIVSRNGIVTIDNKDCNYSDIPDISSRYTVYNGVSFGREMDKITEEGLELQKKRLELVGMLKKGLNDLESTITTSVNEVKKEPVRKLLKR